MVTPVVLSQLPSEIVDLGEREIPASLDGWKIAADINGTKLWSGRKRSGLECGQAEVEGGGELVLLKLQGAG
jgi:hypothetical protein